MPNVKLPLVVLTALFVLFAGGCGCESPRVDPTAAADPDVPVDPAFAGQIREAVRDYRAFGNVDDMMRWAPGLCRIPTMKIRDSGSEDDATHGRKLYWLFAKDRHAYARAGAGVEQPVGQVIVKEAWAPVEGEAPAESTAKTAVAPSHSLTPVSTTVDREGKPYHAGRKIGLYVMMKLGEAAAGTDAGWIYGTLSADGSEVSSAGRVASCMGCHESGTHDRMYGIRD